MNATFRNLSALAVAFGMSIAASPAYSQGKGKGKAKGKQRFETKENHGRKASELPYGLGLLSEKNGNLPSGLQKMKDQDGSLTRGLEQGGKKLTSGSKGKRGSK